MHGHQQGEHQVVLEMTLPHTATQTSLSHLKVSLLFSHFCIATSLKAPRMLTFQSLRTGWRKTHRAAPAKQSGANTSVWPCYRLLPATLRPPPLRSLQSSTYRYLSLFSSSKRSSPHVLLPSQCGAGGAARRARRLGAVPGLAKHTPTTHAMTDLRSPCFSCDLPGRLVRRCSDP